MKKLLQALAWISCALLLGCDTMLPYSPVATPRDDCVLFFDHCCTERNSQSGYYYNGYQDNGWSYCIIQI